MAPLCLFRVAIDVAMTGGKLMSVTTVVTEDVSSEVRHYVQNDARPPLPQKRRVRPVSWNAVERVLSISPPIVLALILLVSWYLGTTYGHVSSLILPTPGDVLASLSNGLSSGLLLNAALVTAQESVLGF